MDKKLKKVDYAEMVANQLPADHRIGKDVTFFDEYSLNPVYDYEFISTTNTFIEIIDAEGSICVNDVKYPVNSHCLIVYLKGQKIRTRITSKHSIQRGVLLSDAFLESMYHDAPRFDEIRFSIMGNPVVPLEDRHKKALDLFITILRSIAEQPESIGKLASAKFAVLSFYYGLLQYAFTKKIETETTRGPRVSKQFFSLLEKNFRKEHTLNFYAAQMKMTRQYLHVTVMNTTGHAPGYWVDHYLTNEAQKMLAEPTTPISEVSEILHFKGCEQFGRFFKKQTGLTPRQFRKSLHKG